MPETDPKLSVVISSAAIVIANSFSSCTTSSTKVSESNPVSGTRGSAGTARCAESVFTPVISRRTLV